MRCATCERPSDRGTGTAYWKVRTRLRNFTEYVFDGLVVPVFLHLFSMMTEWFITSVPASVTESEQSSIWLRLGEPFSPETVTRCLFPEIGEATDVIVAAIGTSIPRVRRAICCRSVNRGVNITVDRDFSVASRALVEHNSSMFHRKEETGDQTDNNSQMVQVCCSQKRANRCSLL